jgi:hypothetical protein
MKYSSGEVTKHRCHRTSQLTHTVAEIRVLVNEAKLQSRRISQVIIFPEDQEYVSQVLEISVVLGRNAVTMCIGGGNASLRIRRKEENDEDGNTIPEIKVNRFNSTL